ncbi:don-glucosyltransferase 1, UDP-GLUCOSYL TRANSFERASE 73C5 [Hibiscus trionum]|uniref:Don-glucosyltransferase 1, UDP-GLUCOSYL TRANSFERASE 73C5 n=1 Tax=Hibiscus trionum TaxID=183268 RepID=A0A9W7IZZ4_HIBTR|nr:don-glucosyltransferase 1, UDP-GLUCOSYL TRANSFERASE 73C5 [Hibiscus trionum]
MAEAHFVLFPFMAQGHLLPMLDIGRLLAQRGVIVTLVTTPHNAGRIEKSVARAIDSGLPIRLLQLRFPGKEVGLPDGVENIDMLNSLEDLIKFVSAANMMEDAGQKLFGELTPRPTCLISDINLYYTRKIATKFRVPRLSFHGFCCFCLLCLHNIHSSNITDTLTSNHEYFTVPGLTEKVEFTRVQLPLDHDGSWKEIFEPMWEADRASYGVVINTFEELESGFVKEYKKAKKAWCIGPVSLNNKNDSDKAERGNKAWISGQKVLKWLDSQEPSSVIYACLGTTGALQTPEVIELGLGLEASNKAFIWVLRENNTISNQVEKWMKEDGFEERTEGRGLVVKGWAPQVLVLSHPAIGGFLTHCGWNSTIEGISAGVPFITLPLSGDQFCNEKLVVQILKIGVRLGANEPTTLGDEKSGFLLNKEHVKNAIDKLMDEGEEGIERRKRAKEFGDKAKKAVEVGGSSYLNITSLIQDTIHHSHKLGWDLVQTSHADDN